MKTHYYTNLVEDGRIIQIGVQIKESALNEVVQYDLTTAVSRPEKLILLIDKNSRTMQFSNQLFSEKILNSSKKLISSLKFLAKNDQNDKKSLRLFFRH